MLPLPFQSHSNFSQLSPGLKAGFGGAGGGILGGLLGSLFGNNKDPYKEAQKSLSQIPGTISPYYQPYIGAGNQALGTSQKQYQNLLNNPGDIYNQLGSGYHESPGFHFALSQALNGIDNAAAAGGMTGTPGHQQQAGQLAENLANQDYQSYLQQVLGLYGTGLQGEQGLANQGLGASNELAQSLANNLIGQGQLGFNQAEYGNQRNSNLFGGLGTIGGLLAGLF